MYRHSRNKIPSTPLFGALPRLACTAAFPSSVRFAACRLCCRVFVLSKGTKKEEGVRTGKIISTTSLASDLHSTHQHRTTDDRVWPSAVVAYWGVHAVSACRRSLFVWGSLLLHAATCRFMIWGCRTWGVSTEEARPDKMLGYVGNY